MQKGVFMEFFIDTGIISEIKEAVSLGIIDGCDGVYRSGASECYYSLNEMSASGPGTYGTVIWKSTSLSSDYSQNMFRTDATFSVRMIPSYIQDGRTSLQGRTCSKYTSTNFTQMKMVVRLRKSTATSGSEKTLTSVYSSGWPYSAKQYFTVPGGTTDPYVLEVIGITTNHRCTGKYGTAPDGCDYMDIPLKTDTAVPTECVGFKLEFATDSTYDLPAS